MRISDWSSDVCSSDLKSIQTPANFIVHSLQEVNDALAHGRVFFMELVKYGVILYQSDDRDLGKPKPKTPEMARSEEHTSELQSLMRISYAVFCLKKQNRTVTRLNLANRTAMHI